jgi:bifunctional DNA-binding transcriptional regulator/antitoxin component of YhaV-PrlF toxin-antitoxin module
MEARFIGKSKLTSTGQLTIPKEAREEINVGEGSDAYWYSIGDALVLVKEILNPKDLISSLSKKRKK